MEIRIESYLSGSHLLECEPEKWDAIVILDSDIPEPEFVAEMTQSHLFLNFDDIESPAWGKRIVSSQMVKSALRFAKKSQHLLVSCRAGQSRSSALAYTIAFENGGAELALKVLNPERHRPNEQVLEEAKQVCHDPGFIFNYRKWKDENARGSLSPYLLEIENEADLLIAAGAVNQIDPAPY